MVWSEVVPSYKGLYGPVKNYLCRQKYKFYVELFALWGATPPQYQRDFRADDVMMVHISAETRNSITPPQFNLIE